MNFDVWRLIFQAILASYNSLTAYRGVQAFDVPVENKTAPKVAKVKGRIEW